MKTRILCAAAAALALAMPTCALAHDEPTEGFQISGDGAAPIRADGHAPIGVMGDHMHKEGEWMISLRGMVMQMDGNRIGTSGIDPDTIATTIPNRFFGQPGQPPTLRVVPLNMTMKMVMLGGMYAPADWLTLMVMAPWKHNEMEHVTYAGAAGTTVLGNFTTTSAGWGDIKTSGLVRLWDGNGQHVHLNLGLSLPTGSITKSGTVLAPNGATPNLRLPYAMQLGSGTWDLLPGITWTGRAGAVGWGAQYSAVLRPGRNGEGYRLGNEQALTAWASYEWAPWISNSLRIEGRSLGAIHGIDPQIVAPVQTANPDYYGGDTVNLLLGLNLVGQEGQLRGHRLALEVGLPVYRDLNGPQLETDYTVMLGYQYAW